jgi:hypothetical protein
MPIFELDAGRPVLVQPMQPAAGTFPADTTSVVANHLGSLLGEPLFPVRTRQQGADGPHLLAVDAAGQPVVVEVVQMLDADALVRALRFAGAAARMSSTDLARAYHGGPERFATELVAFRENVPVAVAHAAARHGGGRLLLVCSEVAENLADVVEFLRQAGRQVEVLQVGVLRGADGRRYVDLSPLRPQVPVRRAVEPATLHMVSAGAADTASQPVVRPDQPLRDHRHVQGGSADQPPAAGRTGLTWAGPVPSAGAAAPTGTFPSVLPVPVGPAAAPPPDPMLAALAGELATSTTLVWARQRRGQRFVVTLRADGLLQLPDGAVFAEPDAAAAAAAGSEYPVDGWRVWRIGDDGPTLAELRSA